MKVSKKCMDGSPRLSGSHNYRHQQKKGIVRRDIAEYGVALSNLAHQTIQQRLELSSIASWVPKFIERHAKEAKDTPKVACENSRLSTQLTGR